VKSEISLDTGLQDLISLNYTKVEIAHKVGPCEKSFNFSLCVEVQLTFIFPFSLLKHYQMPECFHVKHCCFWARATC